MKRILTLAAVLMPLLSGAETIVHDGSMAKIRVDVPALGRPDYDAPVARRMRAQAAEFRRQAEEKREPGDSDNHAIFVLTVDTEVYRAKGLDFVVFRTYDFDGGAHGSTEISVDAVDSKGEILRFRDMFEKPALEALSRRSISELFLDPDLKDELNREEVELGAAPDAKNFSAIYLDGATLVVVFAEYQVGYYGLGNPEARIPCKDLLGVMKPVLVRACRAAGRAGRR